MYKSLRCIEYDKFKDEESAELEANNYELSDEREKYYADKEKALLSSMTADELRELMATPNMPSQAKAYYSGFIKT